MKALTFQPPLGSEAVRHALQIIQPMCTIHPDRPAVHWIEMNATATIEKASIPEEYKANQRKALELLGGRGELIPVVGLCAELAAIVANPFLTMMFPKSVLKQVQEIEKVYLGRLAEAPVEVVTKEQFDALVSAAPASEGGPQ